ncbi:MAG: alpha-galactosidase, partial [Gemmatimonadota bacterium]
APGTRIAREHPEWVLSLQGDGSGLLDLGRPAAREAITAYLDAAIRQYQLTWLRIDYNIDPLAFWRLADRRDPDRVGMAEIRYVEGLYRLWDDLRAAHPGLLIDNCASGGRRIDLETCCRSIPLWRSDNTCDMVGDDPDVILAAAVKNQLMSAGLNRYVPFSTVGQMGASPYLFRSGFNAGIAFAQDVRPADFPRDLLRQAIAEAQRLRPYWLGDFYPLIPPTGDPRDWCVLQYHRPEAQDGIVLAFRRHQSPITGYECPLREIDPQAEYQVTLCHSYDPAPPAVLRGSALALLDLRIDQRPGSVLVEYRRLGPGR